MDFRKIMRAQVAAVSDRANEIRANSLFQVGTVLQGGEAHLIQTPSGVMRSTSLGGVVALGQVALVRRDGGQSFFY